ncbi:MAG: CSLREA domain-containing protein [Solirubrobacterales bacterium]|nr:CSLREA domain-containing protein [Solirubrobacterales bacterium]
MKLFLAGAGVAATLLFSAAGASAATIDVNTTDDTMGGSPTTCSLREAITAANTNSTLDGCTLGSGADVIRLPAGTYRITIAGPGEDSNTTGDFDIKGPDALTIQPINDEARVVIDGNQLDRVFDKDSAGSLLLSQLRVTGGELTGIEDGGGIRLSVGSTTLDGVTVDGNHTGYEGGGIAVYATMSMINSTLSGNRAGGNGGGFYVPGGASVTARSSTIAENVADADGNGNGYGGGFAETGGLSVNFYNVINAGNEGKPVLPADKANDCYSGPNFFPRYVVQTQPLGPLDCLIAFDPGTNQVVTDAKLGPLKLNGGQTPTQALLDGSPAIGTGGTAAPDQCPAVDQNGNPRPADSCDIGAVQYFKQPLPPIPNPTNTTATYDGKNLYIRLKCPARFKPKCISTAVPVTKRKGGKAMARAKKVITRANGWKRVTFVVKPAFRQKVMAMTFVDKKQLVTRQKIRSKRVGKRKAKRPSTVFHIYKVRVKA